MVFFVRGVFAFAGFATRAVASSRGFLLLAAGVALLPLLAFSGVVALSDFLLRVLGFSFILAWGKLSFFKQLPYQRIFSRSGD